MFVSSWWDVIDCSLSMSVLRKHFSKGVSHLQLPVQGWTVKVTSMSFLPLLVMQACWRLVIKCSALKGIIWLKLLGTLIETCSLKHIGIKAFPHCILVWLDTFVLNDFLNLLCVDWTLGDLGKAGSGLLNKGAHVWLRSLEGSITHFLFRFLVLVFGFRLKVLRTGLCCIGLLHFA